MSLVMPTFAKGCLFNNLIVLFVLIINILKWSCRSSSSEMFCRKGVLRNFAKFTGKHLCQSLFFKKVAGLRPAVLLKKSLWHMCFPVNFAKFLRAPLFTEHLWWLLLILEGTKGDSKVCLMFDSRSIELCCCWRLVRMPGI